MQKADYDIMLTFFKCASKDIVAETVTLSCVSDLALSVGLLFTASHVISPKSYRRPEALCVMLTKGSVKKSRSKMFQCLHLTFTL